MQRLKLKHRQALTYRIRIGNGALLLFVFARAARFAIFTFEACK